MVFTLVFALSRGAAFSALAVAAFMSTAMLTSLTDRRYLNNMSTCAPAF